MELASSELHIYLKLVQVLIVLFLTFGMYLYLIDLRVVCKLFKIIGSVGTVSSDKICIPLLSFGYI